MATAVKPTNRGDSPARRAKSAAFRTSTSPPRIKRRRPARIRRNGISGSGGAYDLRSHISGEALVTPGSLAHLGGFGSSTDIPRK
jgi:hypothetical protein